MSGGGDLDPAVLGLDSVRRRTSEWLGGGGSASGLWGQDPALMRRHTRESQTPPQVHLPRGPCLLMYISIDPVSPLPSGSSSVWA